MIIEYKNILEAIRPNLKRGLGDIAIKEYVNRENMINCRLICEQSIPMGGSIGKHTHSYKTEFYIITQGNGLVEERYDNHYVKTGDLVMTGHQEMHSIINIGQEPLVMIAIIVTH